VLEGMDGVLQEKEIKEEDRRLLTKHNLQRFIEQIFQELAKSCSRMGQGANLG